MLLMSQPRLLGALVLLCLSTAALRADEPDAPRELRVGVTTHAYYSWVARLTAGTPVEVVPLVPADRDLHTFKATPREVKLATRLDLLVANGLGHDSFVDALLLAAGRRDLPRVELHRGVSLLPLKPGGHAHGPVKRQPVNPHTYIAIGGALQQIDNLTLALAERLPRHRAKIEANARSYRRELRGLNAWASALLVDAEQRRVATVHDGYAYLLQELGLEVADVVEVRHGQPPTPDELLAAARTLRRKGIRVLFGELDLPDGLASRIFEETGVRVHLLSHLSAGRYAPDHFTRALRRDVLVVRDAVRPSTGREVR